jgi:hypothetical protein
MVMEDDMKRSFSLSDGSTYIIKDPDTDDIKNADWVYSKIYTKSLIEGITTSSEMVDILTKRGIIGPEYEKRAKELSENLSKLIEDLNEAKDTDDRYNKALLVAEARDDLFRWNQRFSSPMSHTCEQLADDARLEHLTFSMIYDESGKRVWNSLDEYVHDSNKELVRKARIEVMLYLQGVSSDFMNETPEALAMKQVEQELANDYENQEQLESELFKEAVAFDEDIKSDDLDVSNDGETDTKSKSKPKPKSKSKSKPKNTTDKNGKGSKKPVKE